MSRITKLIISVALVLGTGLVFASSAGAVNVYESCDGPDGVSGTADDVDSAVCKSTADDANSLINTIVNLMIFFIGVVAVIVIIVSGFTYVTSNGNKEQVTKAKNTLTYAIVGLVVAILAYAIVNWVLDWIT